MLKMGRKWLCPKLRKIRNGKLLDPINFVYVKFIEYMLMFKKT